MTNTQLLRVDLAQRSYTIQISVNPKLDFPKSIQQTFPDNLHAVVIYDQSIAEYALGISRLLQASGRRVSEFSVASGEQSKSAAMLEHLWLEMLEAHTDRGSLIVAVGGGVVGDLAGFAAATFARGIPLVQIPTTLLSQVDSSVGGKTGINLPGAKNIVGAFWQPSLVFIDLATLGTLPRREYISGMAEVVKYGVILLPELFDYLEQNVQKILQRDPAVLNHIIAQSCRAKAHVVQQDERETTGLRAILNYGHTFAHAIETTAGYGQWLHGEAVSIGMNMAALLAEDLGRVSRAFVQRQRDLLTQLDLPTVLESSDAQAMWQAMQHDKKVQHGSLRFILPAGQLGRVELVSGITKQQAIKAIQSAS